MLERERGNHKIDTTPSAPQHVIRPENRQHIDFKRENRFFITQTLGHKKPMWRFLSWYNDIFTHVHHTDDILHKYAQRHNTQFILWVALGGFYIGTILFYLRFKVKVQEKKWTESYGQDVPYYTTFRFERWVQYQRAYFIHFYRYKVFYFLDESVVDPLNDNVLSPKSFDIYIYKRLIRAMNYDKRRDRSFDFLNIGEDDIDDFDDFV